MSKLAAMKRGTDHPEWKDDTKELDGTEAWLSTEEP
jgi:hypothetical protein